MKFQNDSERLAWRVYAAAALGPALINAMIHGGLNADPNPLHTATKLAGVAGDLMLEQEQDRQRRSS